MNKEIEDRRKKIQEKKSRETYDIKYDDDEKLL